MLFGGTFDPPHIGHLVLAECARAQFGASGVVFLPAGEPYRKRASAVTPAAHRLAMTRLAVASNPAFSVDEREIRRPGPTYTVDTLEALHAEGAREIILILGSDAVADMRNWKQPARIRELAVIAVAEKPSAPALRASVPYVIAAEDAPRLAREHREMPSIGPHGAPPPPRTDPVIAMPPIAVSSTLIRERVAQGLPVRYLVPDAVLEYIEQQGLYRAEAEPGPNPR